MEGKPVVFVVDDDPVARESLAVAIRSQDAEVETYASAEELLQCCDLSRFGCLVTDLRMEGMSGLELLEKLRAEGNNLPVIVISGYADVAVAVEAMRAGAVTFLEKPYQDQELWESIRTALDDYRKHRQLEAHRRELQARVAKLTPGESCIMEKMLAGKSNKAIAAEVALGLRTVELRRANIMKKMGAHSLAELVRLNLEAGRFAQGPKQPHTK